MPVIQLILILVAIGIVLWLVNTYVPMDANIKRILNIVVLVVVILWILSLFGILPALNTIRVGN